MLNESNIPLEEDGIEEEILVDEEVTITKAMWGDIGGNIENQTDLQNALDAKQDSLTEAQLNAVNSGITAGKVATYDGYADQIASKADQSALNAEATTREQADTALGTRIDNEALARQSADNGLQTQIDAITSQSDVVDVVSNYAALQAYDTSTLSDNDVIKVLDDETHEDALTYYRWSTTTQTWSYIGQEAPYYSKGQMDVMLQGKQDTLTAGANIQIQNGTISAADTTYTAGDGLNLNGTEFSADTTVLATKSDLEDYYTKPETDNLLAPKLETEVVSTLPATGDESKLYLTPKAHTTQTATGNPVTASITEEAGKIESFKLDGDTYQQSYTGKNLYKLDTGTYNELVITKNSEGGYVLNGTPTSNVQLNIDIPALSQEHTLSFSASGTSSRVYVRTRNSEGVLQDTLPITQTSGSVTSSKTIATSSLTVTTGETFSNFTIYPQLELGSSATSFEPYVGGIPSPSPKYPQPIRTVTGEQTISINGTDYEIDLGNIELCKLSTYQDYIWKDGEDWKVHKATGKYTFTGEEEMTLDSSIPRVFIEYPTLNSLGIYPVYPLNVNTLPTAINSKFTGKTFAAFYTNAESNGFAMSTSGRNFNFGDKSWETSTQARDDLRGNVCYYAKASSYITDTTITNPTLIAQLEAIRTALLQNGANTITNTATGTNLAGDMEIGYYGYNPRNRYDKWLWLDLNNNYEQIGS